MSKVIRLFITRNRKINGKECLFSLLESKGYFITGFSLLDINYRRIAVLPDTNWLFFYSKNGVQSICSQFSTDQMRTKKLAALGPGTAEALKDFGLKCSFVGDGIPENTARSFSKAVGSDSVTFIKASQSGNSIYQLMPETPLKLNLTAYDNKILPYVQIPMHDIAIITSSLNARAYTHHMGSGKKPVICIGTPTATSAGQCGLQVTGTSPSPDTIKFAEYIDQTIENLNLSD